MTDDASSLQFLFTTFVTVCMAIIGFFTKRVIDDVKELKQDSKQCALNLANFKADVAKDYAREVNVQASLNRIHERLDRLPKEIVDTIERRQ